MNNKVTYAKTYKGFLVPSLPNEGLIPVKFFFDEFDRLSNTYGIKTHSDLADLEKVDYSAWVWGIKLEQILTRILQQDPDIQRKLKR